jgi:AcrR family transcriptional regulator
MAEPLTKSARTRQRILDAAAKVFREQGYAHARLSDIAEQAGIQTGSLYYHFDSRDDLVDEILRLGIETAWQHVRDALAELPAATPLERLAAAIRAHTTAVLEIGDYASAQARIVGQIPPEVRKRHMGDQRRYGEYWNELLEAAVAAGEIRPDIDLFVVRMLAFGAMNWTAEWYRPRAGTSADVIADQAVAFLLNGLTPAARSSRTPNRK